MDVRVNLVALIQANTKLDQLVIREQQLMSDLNSLRGRKESVIDTILAESNIVRGLTKAEYKELQEDYQLDIEAIRARARSESNIR